MDQISLRRETAYEFLLRKGLSKVHQPQKRYNLSIAELIDFLNEFAEGALSEYEASSYAQAHSDFRYGANDYAI